MFFSFCARSPGTRKAEDLPFYKPLLYQDENRHPFVNGNCHVFPVMLIVYRYSSLLHRLGWDIEITTMKYPQVSVSWESCPSCAHLFCKCSQRFHVSFNFPTDIWYLRLLGFCSILSPPSPECQKQKPTIRWPSIFVFFSHHHYPSHLVQGKAVDGTHHCGHHQRWRHTNANALSRAGASRRSARGGAEGGAGRAGRGTRRRAVAGGEPGGVQKVMGKKKWCFRLLSFRSDLGCQRSSFIMMMDLRGCCVVHYI